MRTPRAAVLLVISVACAKTPVGPEAIRTHQGEPVRRYDLVRRGYDHNGFLLNPQFGWAFNREKECGPNSDTNADPTTCSWRFTDDRVSAVIPCNTLIVDPDFSNNWSTWMFGITCSDSPLLFTGHVNWGGAYRGAVTYQGWLSWEQYSHMDNDYNFLLETELDHSPSPGFVVGVEMDQSELRNFVTPWFRQLAEKALVETDPEVTRGFFGTKEVIITGVLGIDAEHMSARFLNAELHPVYAMAIRTSDPGADKEVWVILARDAGNEGFCSHRDRNHVLQWPDQRYQVELPIRCGQSKIDPAPFFCSHGAGAPEVLLTIDRERRVALASVLLPPGAIVEGTIEFDCHGPATSTAASEAARLKAARSVEQSSMPLQDRRSRPVAPGAERARKQIAQVCQGDRTECEAFQKQVQGSASCEHVVIYQVQFASVVTPSSEQVTCTSGLPPPFDSGRLAALERAAKPSGQQMTTQPKPPPEEEYCKQRATKNQTAAALCATLRRARE